MRLVRRAHRLARESKGFVASLATGAFLYVVSNDPRLKPKAERLKSILRAGGARLWSEEALPHQERDTGQMIALVPPEASADTAFPLLQEARARGVPCVQPDFVIEQLVARVPRGIEDFLV